MRRSSRTKRSRNNVHPGRNFGTGRSGGGGQGSNTGAYDRRMRPNAQKNLEKYLNLARDAMSDGDIVQAENWYQHADHYQRVINACDEQERAMAPAQRAENYESSPQHQRSNGYDDTASDQADAGERTGERSGERVSEGRESRYQPVFGTETETSSGGHSNTQQQHRHGQRQRHQPQHQPQPQLQSPSAQPQRSPQQARRRPPMAEDDRGLDVPFLMNAPQPVIRPLPVATAGSPSSAVAVAEAANPTPDMISSDMTSDTPAPRRRGRPRKNPDGVAAVSPVS